MLKIGHQDPTGKSSIGGKNSPKRVNATCHRALDSHDSRMGVKKHHINETELMIMIIRTESK